MPCLVGPERQARAWTPQLAGLAVSLGACRRGREPDQQLHFFRRVSVWYPSYYPLTPATCCLRYTRGTTTGNIYPIQLVYFYDSCTMSTPPPYCCFCWLSLWIYRCCFFTFYFSLDHLLGVFPCDVFCTDPWMSKKRSPLQVHSTSSYTEYRLGCVFAVVTNNCFNGKFNRNSYWLRPRADFD